MHYFKVITFLLINIVLTTQAQERYTTESIDEIQVETATYATKDGQNLNLDVYIPQNDSETERATIIFVHGGGFSSGDKASGIIPEFCKHLANYGYVVASINYRLTRKGKKLGFGCKCPAEEKSATINAAVEDLQDATFFLIENRHQYGINPQQIILVGSSAGAEAALCTAYQPPYCYGLDSGPVSFAGVISMSGAIIESIFLYDESAIPSLLFHGTDDGLVPYATASHHYCPEESVGYFIMRGSYSIAQELHKLDVPYWLHTSCGAGHEIHSKPMTTYFDIITEFCHSFVINKNGEERHTIVKEKESENKKKYKSYNFCTE